MTAARRLLARHPGDAVAVALVLYAAVALTVHWAPRSFFSPDALAYRVNVLQIRGASEEEASREVWEGPLSEGFRAGDAQRAPEDQVLADPEWIPYTAEFFERRQLVPLLAAALEPVAGEESLEAASIVGLFAFALLLYALLRTRFGPLPSVLAVLLCLAWPPLWWTVMPLTESWGLALVCLGLLAAVMFLDRGDRRWLWVWGGAVLALGFTRDLTPALVLGAVMVLVMTRGARPARALTITGVLAALPAPLLLGASLREQLAYGLSGRMVPEDDSWGFVLENYPDQLGTAIEEGWDYLFATYPRFIEDLGPLWPLTLPLAAGLVAVLLARPRESRDPFLPLMWGGVAGAVAVFALNPFFNQYRYQLVLLPMAAAGLALLIDMIAKRVARPPAAPPQVAERPGRPPSSAP